MNRIQEDLSITLTKQIRTAIDERTREVANQVIKDISSRIFNSQESDEYYTEEELEKFKNKDGKYIIGTTKIYDCKTYEAYGPASVGNKSTYVQVGLNMIDIYGNLYICDYKQEHNNTYIFNGITSVINSPNNIKFNKLFIDLILKISEIANLPIQSCYDIPTSYNRRDNWSVNYMDVYINVTPIFEKIVELYAKIYPHKDTLTTILDTKLSNEKILKDIRSERAALEAIQQELEKKELEIQDKEKSFKIKDSILVDREIRVTEKELIYSEIDKVAPLIEGIKSVSINLNTLLSSELDGKTMSSNVKKHTLSAIKVELDEINKQLYKQ
jgi:hypothetical protein